MLTGRRVIIVNATMARIVIRITIATITKLTIKGIHCNNNNDTRNNIKNTDRKNNKSNDNNRNKNNNDNHNGKKSRDETELLAARSQDRRYLLGMTWGCAGFRP